MDVTDALPCSSVWDGLHSEIWQRTQNHTMLACQVLFANRTHEGAEVMSVCFCVSACAGYLQVLQTRKPVGL